MIVNLKRCLSILLAVMLLIGIIPAAYAVESGADSTQPEKTVSEGTESTDSIDPTEPTEPTEPPDIANPQDDYAVMSVGSTQKSILLFDYADNGNYTTVLKSQVSCEYKPNGTGAARTAYIKNLGWHFARYGGIAYPDEPLYCIEPWRNYGASTSGNSVDRGVTLDGSGSTAGSNVWYAMPEDYREAIGLILLYSDQMWDHSVSVTTTKKDSNPNVPLRIATQFLIYEIVCGLRDPATFKSNYVNVCGTSGDIFYNAGEASVPYFAPKYNALVDAIQAAKKIPSFTGASVSSAPTITLTVEEISVTDSNGVLSNFSFMDGNGAKFYKSGNTLYITQTGDISESTVYEAARNLPSASDSTYRIWYMSGSSYQTTVSLDTASAGSLNAYFKLKAAPRLGTIRLTKTTEDGKNLSGWKFGIYSDAACECFDANKAYLRQREREERNACVRRLLHQDGEMLTELQAEMSTARQFVFLRRCSGWKPEQVLSLANETHKQLAGAGFEVQRMKKADIKRFLAIYFGASMDGDRMPDVDGAQYVRGGKKA